MSCEHLAQIDRLELPSSLEPVGGDLRVAGHRISLFQIVDAFFDETPIGRIEEMFPTIPPRELGEVLRFIGRHIDLMRGYHAERRAAVASLARSRSGGAPTLEELRRRKAKRAASAARDD